MALIDCRECSKRVSEKAPTCPSCGCPIAAPPPVRLVAERPAPQPQRIVVKGGGGGGGGFVFLLLLAAGVAAYFTKPTEADMRKAVVAKYGVGGAVSMKLGEGLGAKTYTYNDYFVFATFTEKLNVLGGENRLAVGAFGQVIVNGQ